MENQDEMFSNVNDEELNKEILRQQLLDTPVRKLRERIKKKKKKIIKKPKKKAKKEIILYKCPLCPKQFLKKQALVLHEQTHSDVKAFSCDLCDYRCAVKKYISAHKKRVHREKTKYECEFCAKKFTYRNKLNNHLRVHTGEKPFKCGKCDKSFSSSYSLSTHTFIHTGEKPYKCAFCAYACRDSSTLRKHEARHMGTDYRYQCTICHKSYKQKWQLKNHIAEKHFMADVRGHICAHCDRSFKFKQALSTHMQAVHLKTLRMKCELCNVVLTNKANLSAHMLTHLDIRAYKCTFRGCRKSFKDKTTLTKHTITHYPERQHRCDICNRLFARMIRLKVHKQQHCGKSANLECDYCGACFKSKCPLVKHIKYAHSGSKQYICDICHYVAHKRQHIVLHLKYHTEHNLRHCNICKKTYKKPEYLKRHYKKVHKIHFKKSPTNLKVSKTQENLKIKSEPEDSNDEDNLPLTALHRLPNGDDKSDGMSETTARSIIEKNSKHLTKLPDAIFDEFFISRVKGSTESHRVKSVREKGVDRKKKELAKVELKRLMNRARQKMHRRHLEETRRLYNKRMKRFCSSVNRKDPLVIKFYKRKNKVADDAMHSNSEHNEEHNTREHNKFIIISDKVDKEVDIDSENKTNLSNNNDDNELEKSTYKNIKTKNMKIGTDIDNKCEEIDSSEAFDNDTHDVDSEIGTSDDKEYNKCNISNITSQNDDNDNGVCLNEDVQRNSDTDKVIDHEDTNDETSQVNDHKININEDRSKNELVKDNVNDEIKINRKIMINTHQCYLCFKLFSTRTELLDHCKIHFDYCSEKTLKKCPLCNHVTSVAINQHMKRKHNITIKLPYKLKDKMSTENGSRYYYDIDDEHIKEIQIIPTVRYLNRQAYVKIDEKKRKDKNEGMFERVLSKKGKEWVVEQKNVSLSDFKPLPRFKSTDFDIFDANTDKVANYADRIKILSKMAKRVGVKMYYPCDVCEKVCQNMSALKLHSRKHDPNAKPYKAKVWKHKTKDKDKDKDKTKESGDKKVEKPSENRYKKPHPIVNKHKCDQKLKDFYENNVRGGDVEFWQFLKIFNKMEKECISDFSELEERTDFGIHYSEKTLRNDVTSSIFKVSGDKTVRKVKNSDKTVDKVKNSDKTVRKAKNSNKNRIIANKKKYTRVVRLSRRESERRNLLKMKLREKYAKES